jgi:hypothetical protein
VNRADGKHHLEFEELPRSPSAPDGPDPDGASPGRDIGKSGACSALLADRKGNPDPAKRRWLGGLSPRNLGDMRAFAEAWPDDSILQAPLAKLTWYHNLTLLEKVKSYDERLWYAQQTIHNGWSRNVLVMQIESGLYRRQGKAITNFQTALPTPQSDLAQQIKFSRTPTISIF